MKRVVRIIGVPMDLGQNRCGVDMGPSAVRYTGLQARLGQLGHTVFDEGNVSVPNPEEEVAEGKARRLRSVAKACQNIFTIARECSLRNETAIFLGGDHNISIGTVAASAQAGTTGLIWVDAHGDFNTPATCSERHQRLYHARCRRAGHGYRRPSGLRLPPRCRTDTC